jgi:hypothetical protein
VPAKHSEARSTGEVSAERVPVKPAAKPAAAKPAAPAAVREPAAKAAAVDRRVPARSTGEVSAELVTESQREELEETRKRELRALEETRQRELKAAFDKQEAELKLEQERLAAERKKEEDERQKEEDERVRVERMNQWAKMASALARQRQAQNVEQVHSQHLAKLAAARTTDFEQRRQASRARNARLAEDYRQEEARKQQLLMQTAEDDAAMRRLIMEQVAVEEARADAVEAGQTVADEEVERRVLEAMEEAEEQEQAAEPNNEEQAMIDQFVREGFEREEAARLEARQAEEAARLEARQAAQKLQDAIKVALSIKARGEERTVLEGAQLVQKRIPGMDKKFRELEQKRLEERQKRLEEHVRNLRSSEPAARSTSPTLSDLDSPAKPSRTPSSALPSSYSRGFFNYIDSLSPSRRIFQSPTTTVPGSVQTIPGSVRKEIKELLNNMAELPPEVHENNLEAERLQEIKELLNNMAELPPPEVHENSLEAERLQDLIDLKKNQKKKTTTRAPSARIAGQREAVEQNIAKLRALVQDMTKIETDNRTKIDDIKQQLTSRKMDRLAKKGLMDKKNQLLKQTADARMERKKLTQLGKQEAKRWNSGKPSRDQIAFGKKKPSHLQAYLAQQGGARGFSGTKRKAFSPMERVLASRAASASSSKKRKKGSSKGIYFVVNPTEED